MAHSDSASAITGGPPGEARRPFMIRFLAGAIGALVGLVPLLAGGIAFLSPVIRKQKAAGKKLRITSLASIPTDGQPRRFPVMDSRKDAWNNYPLGPIGSVYLRHEPGKDKPECFSATCPHLGCMVDFKTDVKEFKCPCHNSFFTVDGERINPASCPSPRNLDQLEVQVEGEEVFVMFQRFRGGIADKIAE